MIELPISLRSTIRPLCCLWFPVAALPRLIELGATRGLFFTCCIQDRPLLPHALREIGNVRAPLRGYHTLTR